MRKGKLKGWRGIGPNAGQYVAAEDGFIHVCKEVGIWAYDSSFPLHAEFKEMLLEWYFSGNWIEEYEEE